MADYSVTAASVLASPSAKFLPQGVNVLATITPGSGTSARQNVNTAGTTITAGQPVYQDPTDYRFYPADANGAFPLYDVVGIAVNNCAIGQPVSVVFEDDAFTPGCTMAVGDIICLSAAVGKICPSSDNASGMFVADLGVAITTTTMKLRINKAGVVKA